MTSILRLPACIVPAMLALTACSPTHLADPRFHDARSGYSVALAYDGDRERVAGAQNRA
jgi:hypothetical protein